MQRCSKLCALQCWLHRHSRLHSRHTPLLLRFSGVQLQSLSAAVIIKRVLGLLQRYMLQARLPMFLLLAMLVLLVLLVP